MFGGSLEIKDQPGWVIEYNSPIEKPNIKHMNRPKHVLHSS